MQKQFLVKHIQNFIENEALKMKKCYSTFLAYFSNNLPLLFVSEWPKFKYTW